MSSAEELSYTYIERHPEDAARVIDRIPPQETAVFIQAIPVRLAAPMLSRMLPFHVASSLQSLDNDTAAGLLSAMEMQAGVAVLRYFPESRREPLLARLSTALSLSYRMLLAYSRETVGGWMNPRATALTEKLTCEEALEIVRQSEQTDIETLFITDQQHRYRGRLALGDIVRATPGRTLSAMARPDRYALPAQAQLSAVAHHPGWHAHHELAVVEKGDRYVGAIGYPRLMQGLSPASEHTGSRSDTLSDFTSLYWFGVSGLIETLVSHLPVGKPEISRQEFDEQR